VQDLDEVFEGFGDDFAELEIRDGNTSFVSNSRGSIAIERR